MPRFWSHCYKSFFDDTIYDSYNNQYNLDLYSGKIKSFKNKRFPVGCELCFSSYCLVINPWVVSPQCGFRSMRCRFLSLLSGCSLPNLGSLMRVSPFCLVPNRKLKIKLTERESFQLKIKL